jgi:hypothetical protein
MCHRSAQEAENVRKAGCDKKWEEFYKMQRVGSEPALSRWKNPVLSMVAGILPPRF